MLNAALAERERKVISERMIAALAAAKARGQALGNPRLDAARAIANAIYRWRRRLHRQRCACHSRGPSCRAEDASMVAALGRRGRSRIASAGRLMVARILGGQARQITVHGGADPQTTRLLRAEGAAWGL